MIARTSLEQIIDSVHLSLVYVSLWQIAGQQTLFYCRLQDSMFFLTDCRTANIRKHFLNNFFATHAVLCLLISVFRRSANSQPHCVSSGAVDFIPEDHFQVLYFLCDSSFIFTYRLCTKKILQMLITQPFYSIVTQNSKMCPSWTSSLWQVEINDKIFLLTVNL